MSSRATTTWWWADSYEFHVWDPLDPYKCLAILKMAKDVFAGFPTIQIPPQDWLLPEYR